ncbi:btk-binding protein-related [Anaeramoeba flamelloides]|uniref:Btk-binding protein-related n=1 Tax=Anaeramoeba flamelloides TaxID=1746091 RepID=A0AAV7YQ81_9EUKA|nr:btk-binding protein-related [Anaeramoeba flamelloides]
MTEQVKYLIKGTTVTNLTQKFKHTFKLGHGGDSYKAYVDETKCVRQYNKDNREETSYSKIPNVIQICSGYCHYIFLTSEGRVYGVGSTANGALGRNNRISRTNAGEITYFKKKNIKIRKIQAGVFQSYFISTDNKLYASGANGEKQLGIINNNSSTLEPTLVTTKEVQNVWCGNYSYTVYYQELESGKIIGSGRVTPKHPYILTENENFQNKQVVDIAGGASAYLFLVRTQEGKSQVYISKSTNYPKLWNGLSEYKIRTMQMNCHDCTFTTEDNKVLVSKSTGISFLDITDRLPEIPKTKRWQQVCHAWDTLLFPVDNETNTILEDLQRVYQNQILTDRQFTSETLKEFKVHQTWIESRFQCAFERIDGLFIGLNVDVCEELLDWCYGISSHHQLSQKAINFLESIQVDPENTPEEDLKKLYQNNSTKNFIILVKVTDGEEGEDEDEEEQEEEFEEIPVHKFVLLTRSGLFREMFKNVTKESNSVTDYSGKEIESIESLIKYLYTNTLELTADDDPQMVVEDLENAIEYYKLNEKSNLNQELEQIKKLFNL